MLNSKSFLTVDFGAGTLKVAEFEQNESGGLRLRRYGIKPLGREGAQESTREAAVLGAIQEMLAERPFESKAANVCAPGFHVFSKFVKLPPVDTSKVTQIIQYEAQQNVPFPLEEVVWDYQILGTSPSGELEVLLVAIKTDVVEGLFRVAEGGGLKVDLVDVSPAALCNAFRYNYPDQEGCTMMLDIGAKTSNLLFFEKDKVYSRSINIGANSITQDFANETKMSFDEAEQFKIAEGFVSLGGAYEEPENPNQALISKIARQVMTRLHMQVNQTINFYRGQQGGSMPQRLFLCGGASIMPYMAQFFAEKLNLPVDYFNPFRNLELDQDLNLEELASVAHAFGENVGLALRNLAHCPVELNLMPRSSLQRQQFGAKKPYLVAAVFSLVLAIFGIGWVYGMVASIREAAVRDITERARPLRDKDGELRRVRGELDKTKEEFGQIAELAGQRTYWADLLAELQQLLHEVETVTQQRYGVPAGVWIERLLPLLPEQDGVPGFEGGPDGYGGRYGGMADPGLMDRYRMGPGPDPGYDEFDGGFGGGYDPMMGEFGMAPPENAISQLNLLVRAVHVSAAVNNEIAFTLRSALEGSPFFDEGGVRLDVSDEMGMGMGMMGGGLGGAYGGGRAGRYGGGAEMGFGAEEERPLTFALQISLKLKRPFQF
jgi:type IV pilus assembly protein PilM